jgi:hypothetical protein
MFELRITYHLETPDNVLGRKFLDSFLFFIFYFLFLKD